MWNGTQPSNHKMFPKQTSKTWLLARNIDRIAWNQSFTECQNNRLPLVESTQSYFLTSWEEAIASDRNQRPAKQNVGLAFFSLGRRKKIGVMQMCRKMCRCHNKDGIYCHQHVHGLEYTCSAKSRLAKQGKQSIRGKGKQRQSQSSRTQQLQTLVRAEGEIRRWPVFLQTEAYIFVTVHIFLILDRVTVALSLFR